MKTKQMFCLGLVLGIFAISTSVVLAKWNHPNLPETYASNMFSWYSEVPSAPNTNDVVSSKIFLVGTGGIKVNSLLTGFGKYEVDIDGSGLSTGASNASSAANSLAVNQDFNAAPGNVYFVTKPATCTFASAVGSSGKEVLVWNDCSSGGTVTYNTSDGQTISGEKSGAICNPKTFKLDRFMSDGSNWLKE